MYTQELKQRIQKVIDTWGPSGSQPSEAEYKEQMRKIRKNSVNFHGEMVLLENYSNINYTGTWLADKATQWSPPTFERSTIFLETAW